MKEINVVLLEHLIKSKAYIFRFACMAPFIERIFTGIEYQNVNYNQARNHYWSAPRAKAYQNRKYECSTRTANKIKDLPFYI